MSERESVLSIETHPCAMQDIEHQQKGDTSDHYVGDFLLSLIAGSALLGLGVGGSLQELHVGPQGGRDGDGRNDASNGSQDQH